MSIALAEPVTSVHDVQRLEALERYDILDTPAEPAFERIARLVRLIFDVETSIVSLIDAHRQWHKAADGTDIDEVPIGRTFCRFALDRTEPLIVPDATEDIRFRNHPFVVREDGVRFYASMPIITPDGFSIGTVCAIGRRARTFSEREAIILKELAQIVMNEIELRHLASTDGLTGLGTRRAFKEEAERLVNLARRHRTALSLISFDIDHFKVINDTYGHAAGDMVLKAIGKVAGETPRQSDLLGRLGGEEFALLVPGADGISAASIAETLRQAILALVFPGNHPPIRVSASFGVAMLDPGRDDLDSLLVKADEALYEAKRAGRNRVVTWHGATAATTRVVERRRVLKAGLLVFNNRNSTLDCTVKALWEQGAEVQVSDTKGIPETVTLDIPSAGTSWPTRVTMRRPTLLELEFI